MHAYAFYKIGTTRYYGLALAVVLLILLILGRKDFRRN
jgi:hypothetical protein